MNINIAAFSSIVLAVTAVLLATGLVSAGDEYADHDDDAHQVLEHKAVRSLAEQGDILSLEQILHHARQLHAGRVLEIELEKQRSSLVYEVEILDNSGEVWEMNFDARSGELLEEVQED